MKQQTAVEFLLSELDIVKLIQREKLTMAAEVVRQAKVMEKEQMYQVWLASEQWSDGKFLDSKKTFEEYYNETFNQK
jgi:hypothetical protein